LSRPLCVSAFSKFSTRQDSALLYTASYGTEVHTVSYTLNYFTLFNGQFSEKRNLKKEEIITDNN